ncbi:hypothetical protein RFI_33924, partial [Reticulomyxa filosa]
MHNIFSINFYQRFENSNSEWKCDDTETKLISVIKTDLRIRELEQANAPIYSEMYVIDLLNGNKDTILSQSILKFLFQQSKEVWDNICSMDNDNKCWEVMLTAFQKDFGKWNSYLAELENKGIFGDDSVRKSFLNQFIYNNEFIKLHFFKNKRLCNAFFDVCLLHLAHDYNKTTKKKSWKEEIELLVTIENYSGKILYEKEAVFGLIDLLWNVNKFHCFKLELNDSSDSERRRELVKELLEKGQTNLKNLEVWVQFFNYIIEKNEDEWEELLIESLKDWWYADNFGERPSGKWRHRKVLWFLRPSRYNKIPGKFRYVFKTQVESTSNSFLFDNKCWDKDSKSELDECIGESLSDLSMLNWLLELLIQIPFKCDSNEVPSTEKESNEDEQEEKTSSQGGEDKNGTELLKKKLEYCVLYVEWKQLLVKHRNKMNIFRNLYNFIQTTLETLDSVIKEKKIDTMLYDFIKSKNEAHIKILWMAEDKGIDEQVWKDTLDKYENFKQISNNFKTVVRGYFETIPNDLQQFHEYVTKFGHCCLLDIEKDCAKSMKMLNPFKNDMQLMIDREDSELFRKMWTKRRATYSQNPISTMNAFMDVFKQANSDWEYLATAIKNNTLRYSGLEWCESMDWKLEMSILFPNVGSEAKDKMQENQKEIENAVGLRQTKHCWQILKQATEIIQNAHKNKSTIKSDEVWQTFLKQFEFIGQFEHDKEKTSMKEASNCYCICMECFGDIAKSKKNEKKIGEFATNEIFTNKEQFEYAIQKMDDSLNENFRHLVGKLRKVNKVLQKKIWNRTYVSISELAKAVIELYKESNSNFQEKLKDCLNMDFDEFFRFIKEGDQLP